MPGGELAAGAFAASCAPGGLAGFLTSNTILTLSSAAMKSFWPCGFLRRMRTLRSKVASCEAGRNVKLPTLWQRTGCG